MLPTTRSWMKVADEKEVLLSNRPGSVRTGGLWPLTPQSLWRGLLSHSVPPPLLFLDLKCAVQSGARSDWEGNEKSFGPQKKKKKKKIWKWNIFSESLFHFLERFCGGRPTWTAPAHVSEPINFVLVPFLWCPSSRAFAQTNLQSSLSSQLPLDPSSHASAALPSPNKPLMRPTDPPPFFLVLFFHT